MPGRHSPLRPVLITLGGAFALALGLCGVALLAFIGDEGSTSGCGATAGSGVAGAGATLPPGSGRRVGASEYGGPGDPSSGTVGSMGVSLLAHPDSYAELGGTTFGTATAMGGLPYMTPLRITAGDRSVIAYKRDIGLGGGPVAGLPRVIDLWWELADRLGLPYENGLWSGAVTVERPPATGAANVLQGTPAPGAGGGSAAGAAGMGSTGAADAGSSDTAGVGSTGAATTDSGAGACALAAGGDGVTLTAGSRAELLPDGQAAAPQDAPAAVKGIIAAGNEIVGKPYVYGAGHGLPLSEVAPAYDCSSSVEHLLYGGGLLPVDYGAASGALERFGAPGPGRWVTIYASADHVFMYVAGLRWDTHDAAGPGDGSTGIGWHPLVRESAGFVARHPVGL